MNSHGTSARSTHKDSKRFVPVVALNVGITVVELVGGAVSGSLSLISDAFHNLGDAGSILLAFFAHKVAARPADEKRTFGYKRATVLAAFINAVALIFTGGVIVREAIERAIEPKAVNTTVLLTVASLGLLVNILSMILLKESSSHSMNMRSAFLHMLSDALSSLSVIAGAVVMHLFGLSWMDWLISIPIAGYIVWEGGKLLARASHILLQGAPTSVDLSEIVKEILAVEGVADVHHIHLWNLDENTVHFEAHVNLVSDMRTSETAVTLSRLTEVLSRHGIDHVTVQFEFDGCPECKVADHVSVEHFDPKELSI